MCTQRLSVRPLCSRTGTRQDVSQRTSDSSHELRNANGLGARKRIRGDLSGGPMPEVLVVFDAQLASPDDRRWTAQACGAIAEDGLWEGWIEFLPVGTDESPIRTPRETEQPNRDDVMYWAQGLTAVYLDGALTRALKAHRVSPRRGVAARTAFDGPARSGSATNGGSAPHATFNPFEVYQQGESILIAQLGALDTPRLRDLAVAYGFSPRAESADAGREALTASIVAGVRSGLTQPAGETRRER
jgi:hypothetical protein